jgi:RNA polymerase sigma-70 factor (sigma-E family)
MQHSPASARLRHEGGEQLQPHHDHAEAGFTDFVRTKQLGLIRFAWLISGGSYSSAEDLVQEALTRLYGKWSQVVEPEPYARTIIARLNVSRWRKVRREVLTAFHDDRALVDARLVMIDEDAGLIREVLALPARQRTAVILHFWCDQSNEQIAQALGCTPVTVRTNLHRALSRLRANWPEPTFLTGGNQ